MFITETCFQDVNGLIWFRLWTP